MNKLKNIAISLILAIMLVAVNTYAATPLIDNVFHITDNQNRPVPGGKVYTYEPGTTTPKLTYSDEAGTVPHANPVTLDTEGKKMIYGIGAYTIDVKDMFGAQINGWPKLVYSDSRTTDQTIADLRTHTGYTGDSVQVLGYYVPGDGGGGPPRIWEEGPAPGFYVDNGGSIIVPNGGDGSAAWLMTQDKIIDIRSFGVVLGGTNDNSLYINNAFNFVKSFGGEISVRGFASHTSKLVFDTSADAEAVTFRGSGERNSGFLYVGPDDQAGQAVTLGVDGISNSGFVRMFNIGVYGQGQTIDGVHIYSGQRWQVFDRFTVRTFDGMGIDAGDAEVFLNTWGDIKLLNLHRAANLGPEFNANTVANIVIENCGTATTNTRYDATVPVFKVDGIGTNIDVISIESCPAALTMEIANKVTVDSIYHESNNTVNAGVDSRPVIFSGTSPKINSGNVKLPGINADTSGFYVIDLTDSDNAFARFDANLPTPNSTSFQNAVLYGSSKRSVLDINWQIYDGVGRPSRNERNSIGLSKSNITLNNVDFIFGMPKAFVGKLLMTEYCRNIRNGRVQRISDTNRPEGLIETNINIASINTREFGLNRNKFVTKYSQAASAPFFIYEDLTLSNRRYLFTSFNARKSTSDPLPRIRASNGTQDFIVQPNDQLFVGWTQTSLVQAFDSGNIGDVRWYPFYSEASSGSIFHGISLVVDLGQFEIDFGVSFDGMSTFEIADLIRLEYINNELNLVFRPTSLHPAPDFGDYYRGEIVYTYPPKAGERIGWVATADIENAAVDNTAFREYGTIAP